jgi:plastocyanin
MTASRVSGFSAFLWIEPLTVLAECIADYGAPKKSTWTPPPKESRKPDAKPTHTVMVAPVDGVPRFLPFALNATIGDTVRFIWAGKKEHSVTMSSSLSVCNKSQAADAFDSDLLSGKDGEKTCEYL